MAMAAASGAYYHDAEDVEDEGLVGGDVDVDDLEAERVHGVHEADEPAGLVLPEHLDEQLVPLHLTHLQLRLHPVPTAAAAAALVDGHCWDRVTPPAAAAGTGERRLLLGAVGRRGVVVVEPDEARRRRVVDEHVGRLMVDMVVFQLVLQLLHLLLQPHDVVDRVSKNRRAIHLRFVAKSNGNRFEEAFDPFMAMAIDEEVRYLGDVWDERAELVEVAIELLPPLPLRLEVLALLPLGAAGAPLAVAVVLRVTAMQLPPLRPGLRHAAARRVLHLLLRHRHRRLAHRHPRVGPRARRRRRVAHGVTTTTQERVVVGGGGVEQVQRRAAVHQPLRVGASVPLEAGRLRRRPRLPPTVVPGAAAAALRHDKLRHLLLLRHLHQHRSTHKSI